MIILLARLFGLYFHIIVCLWRKLGQEHELGRNLETGADAEAVEESCLVSYESFYTSQFVLENMRNVLHIFVRYFCFYILFYKFPFTRQEHLMGYDTIYNSDSQNNKIKSVCWIYLYLFLSRDNVFPLFNSSIPLCFFLSPLPML